jgi:hemerythrin-like domain-containing protein
MVAQKLGTEIRKQQIAQAALSLVSSHGLKGLSIAGIAGRVGFVPSAVYRHFKNKDQVIEAILDLVREKLLTNVQKVIEATSGPLARLRRVLQLHIELIRKNPGILRLVFSEEVMGGPPARRARVQAIIGPYLREVAEIVHQGQKEGVIQTNLDPGSVSVAFLGMILPAAILWHLSQGKYDLPNHIDRAWNIFLGGIVPPPNSNPSKTRERMVAMTATEVLRHEHKIILKVLDAVQREAQAIAKIGKLDLEKLDKILNFFRVFVDQCHHGKEEEYLFPTMGKRGFPADKGPIPVMLHEHEVGRTMVKATSEALSLVRQGDAEAKKAVATHLTNLAEHLQSHIAKENEVLFPMADKVFTPEDQQALVASFEKHEAEEIGAGVHEKYHQLAHELAQD